MGVLTFVALTGLFPFKGATDQELYRKINAAEYPRHELYFSKEVADLIAKMLRINPDERITAPEVTLDASRYWRTPGSLSERPPETNASHRSPNAAKEPPSPPISPGNATTTPSMPLATSANSLKPARITTSDSNSE